MTHRAIDFASLSPEQQKSLEPFLPSPEQAARTEATIKRIRSRSAADNSAVGRKRQQTGKAFESDLDMFHTWLEFNHLGKIRRNHIPTKMIGKGKRVSTGAAHVDRTGWVKIASDDFYEVIPVAFDAKVLGLTHSTYQHAKELQHQLHDLREAANAGECAFLLVMALEVDRLYALPIGRHFDALLRGDGVTLFRSGAHFGADEFPRSVVRDPDTSLWNWIPLVEYSAP